MDDCLFCKLAADKANLVWETDTMAAFKDIHPKAPVHILVVPKQHVSSLDDVNDPKLGWQLIQAVQTIAKAQGIAGGYRVMINVGRKGGQVIDHLHIHILGGKHFSD